MALQEELFTGTFDNSGGALPIVLELVEDDGIDSISIKCTTPTAVTILGTKSLFGVTPTAVTIDEDQVFTWSAGNGTCCLTITIPVGAIAEITAM